jgi:hypothetical protein
MSADIYPSSQVASAMGTNASSFREKGIVPFSATATPGAAVIPVGTVSRLVYFPVPVAGLLSSAREQPVIRDDGRYGGGGHKGACGFRLTLVQLANILGQ